MLKPYLLLGEIVRPQGIRGEVKVRHYTDDPSRFLDVKHVYILQKDAYVPLGILACRIQKDDVFLKVEGVTDRDQAEALRGTKLYIDRENAKPLGKDEVFIADIIGATAYNTKGEKLGTLAEVLTPGSVDVFVFETPRGKLMMPALKTVLLELDAVQGKIVLDEQRLGEVAVYEHSDSDDFPPDV